MRRVHLRHHPNILKRLLVHVAAFNLGLVMRKLLGRGTPRGLQGHEAALFLTLLRLLREVGAPPVAWKEYADSLEPLEPPSSLPEPSNNPLLTAAKKTRFHHGLLGPARQTVRQRRVLPVSLSESLAERGRPSASAPG